VKQVAMKQPRHSIRTAGLSLPEMLIATFLVATLGIGIYTVMVNGLSLNYASAQRVAAFGLCQEVVEQMRGSEYANVNTNNFTETNIRLTHLGGSERLPLNATRRSTIADQAGPTRKDITVTVEWTYRGKPFAETATAVLFEK